jgi:hypothetical protein
MPNLQRLEFVTRHFRDLQMIRFAPVPAAMLLGPFAAYWMPHVNRAVAWVILLSYLSCVVGFYWWSTLAMRRRYGSVKVSRDEALRMLFHPAIFVPYIIVVVVQSWLYFLDPQQLPLGGLRRIHHFDRYAPDDTRLH